MEGVTKICIIQKSFNT